MTKYTHIVIDNLGSFPAIGDAVLEINLSSEHHQMKIITDMSLVSERLPSMRWAYVTLVDMVDPANGQQSKLERGQDWYAFPHAISLDPD